jgi:hypothetical protein
MASLQHCVPVKMTANLKLIIVSCAAVLLASPAIAQGGGGFGMTLGAQNVGPKYPGDEERDAGVAAPVDH